MEQDKPLELLLEQIIAGQTDIKAKLQNLESRLNAKLSSQDNEIESLQTAIKDNGKYTIRQIVGALVFIIPVIGFFKDIFRIWLVGK